MDRLSNILNLTCDKCDRTDGYRLVKKEGYADVLVKCDCYDTRKARRLLLNSPLLDVFNEQSLETFKTPTKSLKILKNKVTDFTNVERDDRGRRYWLLLSGEPGKGKTHLCTAAYMELLIKGYDGEYVKYTEVIPALERDLQNYKEDIKEKAQNTLDRLCNVTVLYIDDLYKVRKGLDIIWTIIDSRYTKKDTITIISTEYDEQQMFAIDNSDSLPSRIYERCGRDKNFIKLGESVENYRLQGE